LQNSIDNSIDIILPVYNEEGNIESIINDISVSLEENEIFNYQIIISEDGSTDNTKSIINDLSKRKKIKLISFENRLGYTKSILNAINLSDNDLLIFLDSDGQHDVKDILKFINNYDNETIIGYRKNRSDNFGRKLLHKFVRKIISMFIQLSMKDASCGVVMIEKNLMKNISKNIGFTESCFWWEFSIIFSKSKINFIEKEINHLKRGTGTGFFNLKDLFRLVFKEFFGIFKLLIFMRKNY